MSEVISCANVFDFLQGRETPTLYCYAIMLYSQKHDVTIDLILLLYTTVSILYPNYNLTNHTILTVLYSCDIVMKLRSCYNTKSNWKNFHPSGLLWDNIFSIFKINKLNTFEICLSNSWLYNSSWETIIIHSRSPIFFVHIIERKCPHNAK